MEEKFRKHIEEGYTFKNDSILLGTSMLDGRPVENNQIKAPLQTFKPSWIDCWCNWNG